MVQVYLGLGSNVERIRNIKATLDALRIQFGCVACSPVFESEAQGHVTEPYFNLVVAVETSLAVGELKARLREIEAACGRVRMRDEQAVKSCAMDIDILLYRDLVGDVDGVQLPHRDVLRRAYVLQPLALIAPELVHPQTKMTMEVLWRDFSGSRKLRAVSTDCVSSTR